MPLGFEPKVTRWGDQYLCLTGACLRVGRSRPEGPGFFGPILDCGLHTHNRSVAPGGCAVKNKRFSVEQITAMLRQVGGGVPVADVCRQVGISEQTFYRWKQSLRRDAAQRSPRADATPRRKQQPKRLESYRDGRGLRYNACVSCPA
jgi:transposase-like protein